MSRSIIDPDVINAHRATIGDFHADVLLLGQGAKYEDIALVCGIKVGTVKSRLNRARAALAAALAKSQEATDASQGS